MFPPKGSHWAQRDFFFHERVLETLVVMCKNLQLDILILSTVVFNCPKPREHPTHPVYDKKVGPGIQDDDPFLGSVRLGNEKSNQKNQIIKILITINRQNEEKKRRLPVPNVNTHLYSDSDHPQKPAIN